MPRPSSTRRLAATLAGLAVLCAPAGADAAGLSRGTGVFTRRPAADMSLGTGAMFGLAAPAGGLSAHLSFGTALFAAAPASAPDIPPELASVVASLAAAEEIALAAEQAAARSDTRSDRELARRLVAGQVMLTQRDSERAAVVFLDLLENAPGSPAAAQARFYLGEALLLLGMRRWAAECFSSTLADPGADARRLHQKSVARLLGLASPSRAAGHARKPGLGALPELRARMQALGLTATAPQTPAEAPRGDLGPTDILRLRGWVAAIAPDQRSVELAYAHGRHLFLSREYGAALAELEVIAPGAQALDLRGPDARFRLRATYIAGAAAAALGRNDLAFERFDKLALARVRTPEDREIRDLSWLARARIHSDRGEQAEALRAYRQIGRDSPLFAEAMYEAAWALLRAGRPEVALSALELVVRLAPDGPIAPEALQLRGKLHIQQRAWTAANAEFTALRRDFDARARALAGALTGSLDVQADAAAYYAAVARNEGPDFKLDAVLPRGALGLARGLRRAAQAENLARETGAVTRMLGETRELLARMETAAQAPERPRLFTDLGAHWTAIDQAGFELVDAAEQLLSRASIKLDPRSVRDIEARRREQREALDTLRSGASLRARRITGIGELLREVDTGTARLRAQVLGLEQGQLGSGRPRGPGFFTEAAAVRSELAESEAKATDLRARLVHARSTLRFTDPLLATRRAALVAYRTYLTAALDGAAKAAGDPAITSLLVRIRRIDTRLEAARSKLEIAANRRLVDALVVLREERENLDRYLGELTELGERAHATVGQATAAAVRDLGGELKYWTTRSEVGQLDVAWAVQHSEQTEAEQLERTRDQALRELDRALDQVMEEIE